jgi:hypothetical protein
MSTFGIFLRPNNITMANAERQIQLTHDLLADSKLLCERFEAASIKYHRAVRQTYELLAYRRWQKFFGEEPNAVDFYNKLEKTAAIRNDKAVRGRLTNF